jgi:HD-GYP domain-containing protein (c-di-GMP phosphodiesterase class II)
MLQGSKDSSVKFLLVEEDSSSVITEHLRIRTNRWVNFCAQQEGISQAWIGCVDEKNFVHWLTNSPQDLLPDAFSAQMLRNVVQAKKVFTFCDHEELISGGLFPLIRKDRVIGVLALQSNQTDYFKPGMITWINALATTIADNLFVRGETDEEKQVEHQITRILQSSLDVRDQWPNILKILADVLAADAITLIGFFPPSRRFEVIATHGLKTPDLAKLRLFLESGLAGKSLDRHQLVWIEDLQSAHSDFRPIYRLDEDGYRGYLALPLIGHNDPTGMIEVFWRQPQPSQRSHQEFLERIAEQTAFAIQRAGILKDLRHRNEELQTKYDAMIEGLSRALEIRDIETEGHTRRVSQFAMRLVEHMHIPPDTWDSIRQGALLHDIGKLGIPDAILLKPGSLTPQERKVMQQHVMYGYNILAPIISARHTLDITLYHHEHWDGKGYPYGLKAEQIPLVARLFTIIDVYDALKSDRPYRSAWSHSQVLQYLREQAGREFDPNLVKLFLEIADEMI